MNIHPVDIDLNLPDDQLLDLFLFQWHTPDPIAGHSLAKIQAPALEAKRVVLEQFHDWFLLPAQQTANAARPAFVILPEVSLPLGHESIIESLLLHTSRPLVVIAGFEHLTWGEYATLRAQMNSAPFEETPANNTTHLNLAGTWIRDCNSNCRRYLQSKLHPADGEQPEVHAGENVLVFRSRQQGVGRRLNFCVQVCSDFCRQNDVLHFRQEIDNVCAGHELDFTFLLQCNRDQEVAQFREAVAAYFCREAYRVATQNGCLVFANNASGKHGKSVAYGSSRVNYPYNHWRHLPIPDNTYRLHNYETHQAAVVRESGPGVYWFTYKPQCLVDARPGSGQSRPFNKVVFCPIGANGLECDAQDAFYGLPAEQHWLNDEWTEDEAEFPEQILSDYQQSGGANPEFERGVVPRIRQAYAESANAWRMGMADAPAAVRPAVNRYFVCWNSEDGHNYPSKEPEPHEWDPNVATGVKKLMRCYALMKIGDGALPGQLLSPNLDYQMHVRFADAIHGVFLWGGRQKSPQVMIAVAKIAIRECVHLTSRVVLILVDPDSDIDPQLLRQQRSVAIQHVTKASTIEGLGRHLQPDGEVTNALEKKTLGLLWSGALMLQLYNASDSADLQARLRSFLSERLSAEEETDGQAEGH